MSYRRTTGTRNAVCGFEASLFDDGTIEFRSGDRPLDVNDSDAGVLLATASFDDPAFGEAGAANPGEAAAEAITGDDSIDESGEVGHAVFRDSNGDKIGDATCGPPASGADIIFDNPFLVQGGELLVPSLKLIEEE